MKLLERTQARTRTPTIWENVNKKIQIQIQNKECVEEKVLEP